MKTAIYKRPSFDEYYMGIALEVAARSTCLRRRYGAVLVKENKIVSTGYNGAAKGEPNCCDIGTCVRKKNNIEPGTRYELCVAVHAEANCLLSASREEALGATLYIAGIEADSGARAIGKPCMMCERLIKNAGVAKVVY